MSFPSGDKPLENPHESPRATGGYVRPEGAKGQGLAITSMVLGILSMLLICCCALLASEIRYGIAHGGG